MVGCGPFRRGRVLLGKRIEAVGLSIALAAISVAGQSSSSATARTARPWVAPKTPDGQPDLQGVWLSNSATPLERPKIFEGRPFLTDDEVAQLKKRAEELFRNGNSDFAAGDAVFLAASGDLDRYKSTTSTENSVGMIERHFDNRTSLIIDPPDGRIPPLTAAAQQRRAAAAATARRFPAGPEEMVASYRCITTGVPKLGGLYGSGHYSYYQIIQTPGYVVVATETVHDARVIPLDGRPHLPNDVRLWNGDSRGRWEGATLVVDTANFSSKSNFMGSADHLHLIERFTRVGPDTINYEITIDDPTMWTKSWTAMVPLSRSDDKIYEWACHEGNWNIMKGMLAAAREDEKAADEAARKR